jgi:hypothetical protein
MMGLCHGREQNGSNDGCSDPIQYAAASIHGRGNEHQN